MLTQLTRRHGAALSVFVNPLVLWLWVAGAIIALGGLVAAWPGPPVGAPRARPPAPRRARGRGRELVCAGAERPLSDARGHSGEFGESRRHGGRRKPAASGALIKLLGQDSNLQPSG